MDELFTTEEYRLNNLEALMQQISSGKLERPQTTSDVNNHIHTFYSFSPYSPAQAVWRAYQSGLSTAGIMDHDSISGAREFIEAGKIVGLATTIGIECRADFSKTPLSGRRINNPDQNSIAYIALHGIPHSQIDEVDAFFGPFRQHRNQRNKAMIEKLNSLFIPWGISIDFDKDVVPLSKATEGGSITERHLLFAVAKKLLERFGAGEALLEFLVNDIKLNVSAKLRNYLTDAGNEHLAYDLLGLLKSELLSRFYIDASLECPDIADLVKFAKRIGAIVAYAYLGDVGDSVTGDKKAQKFEDDYLDLLFETLKMLDFDAVTYMPSRNSREQLVRIQKLCDENNFFQISGEDVNSSRQSFICEAMRSEGFNHLVDSAWALIGHEKASTQDLSQAMFSSQSIAKCPELKKRILAYKQTGLTLK